VRRAGLLLTVCACLASRTVAQSGLTIDTAARALQPGELIVATLTADHDVIDVEVSALGQTVPAHRLADGRWQALLGIDLDREPGPFDLSATGTRNATRISSVRALIVAPKQFATRTLNVNPDFVNPPAKVRARIETESKLLAAVYAASPRDRVWSAPFVRPVPHRANSRFGLRSVFNGEPRGWHAGTDFLSPAGTPVRAPNAGRVVVARSLYFSGNTVIIDHGASVFSQLAHLSRIDVREGATIEPGHVVGLVGATGRVTGAHLHWGFRVNGTRVDALAALALLGDSNGSP
jgi:murein DD-endopeptidase MepM/ murein hydrolase activator NlpD